MRVRGNHRRGSIYITVLGVSMLVLVTGLGVLVSGRAQARTASNANDFAEARLAARSGIELGMLAIYNDPYWRTHLGNAPWYTNKAVGNGTFSLSAVDPVDNDVTNGENDPVVLTSTGMKGSAKYIMSVRMEVSARVGSCLEVSACAGNNIQMQSTTLTSDQTISSNASVSTGGSTTVNANVEAYHQVQGSGYTKTTKVTGLERTLPDPAHACDYYTSAATSISYSSLLQAQSNAELIANEDFELNTTGWYAISCTLQRVNNVYKQGLYGLRVTSRNTVTDCCAYDIPTTSFVAGHAYTVNFPAYSSAACNMQVVLTLVTTTGTYTFTTPLTAVLQNTWTNLQTANNAPLVPTWTGSITRATVSVSSDSTNKDYFIDGVSFKDTTYQGGSYVMEGKLLSPTSNPYGSPNANGIYILNCSGKQVVINNCRIIGTLVMMNPGNNCTIKGSTVMEAAAANFPALLVNSTNGDNGITISLSSSALSEANMGVNFNPTGNPYPYQAGTGTNVNATTTDTYTSGITGLVYSVSDLTIDTGTTITGVVISNGKINFNATSETLHYNSLYLNNPPPGFTLGTIQMAPVPGTWARVAN
jgi:hypothetical protein